jgi:hypothetical protein
MRLVAGTSVKRETIMSLQRYIVCALIFGSGLMAEYPVAKISNSKMQVTVYLPDAKNGFYKGLRFDWSGMIASVEAGGHSYYGPWFARVDPSVRDFAYQDADIVASSASAALGPAEEFQVPLGYDTAKPGETFVKVGVGVLRKADDTPYNSYKTYEVVDTGSWSVKKTGDSIRFTQTLNSPKSDYKYVYTKTILLASGKAEMSIEHTLRNTGPAAIHTRLYDHNFLRIDNAEVGPDLVVTLPFEIKPTRAADPLLAKTDGNRFLYLKTLQEKDRVASGLQGFGSSAADYNIQIENRKAGAGLRIRGDQPLANLSLWSIRSVVAVEPFIDIAAEPGKEFSWKYTYSYYSVPHE